MSGQLDPKIAAKLHAFARRRRKLIILRGICTAVAMLLATMMLVAVLDWLLVLPDAVRWGLSGAAYLAVIAAEWRTCLRLLTRAPGPRRLARLVEHAEPKLREDLLSAVELGSGGDAEIYDSPRFRELVQSDVAARVEHLDIERLLPVHLIKRYLAIAGTIVAALLTAFALTGSQLGTLLVRALFPMANVARVSKYTVTIVQPGNPEQVVPYGETVPLVIQVSGGRAKKAVLETFNETGGRELLQMTPVGGDKFSASIQVSREDVRYRVRAGDAITRKYRLDAEPRPHVAKFRKTYVYPAYVRMKPVTVSEDGGDLTALEGSEVEITLETSQPVREGELRLEQGNKSSTILLRSAEGTGDKPSKRLDAKVPMDVSGTYRVYLVAASTGFENKFSPEYEIRVEPDLVPEVTLEQPRRDLILPANEAIDLQATATDDRGLASVSQLVRLNEGTWQETVLAKDPGARITVMRRWDLAEQGVKAGDLLTFKMQAVDLKGSKAESAPLQVAITQAGFEPGRLQTLGLLRQVHHALRSLRTAAESLEKKGAELRAEFERPPASDGGRRQAAMNATAAFSEFEQIGDDAWSAVTTALRGSEPGHMGADLVVLGRMLCRVTRGTARSGRDAMEIVSADVNNFAARDLTREIADGCARAAQRAALAEEAYRALLGAEEIDVLIENIEIISGEQERLAVLAAKSGDDPVKWSPVAKRLHVVAAETRGIDEMIALGAEHMSGNGEGERLRRLRKHIEEPRAMLEQALKNNDAATTSREALTSMAKLCAQFSRELLAVRRDLLALKRESLAQPVQTVAALLAEIQPTYVNFDRLQQDLRSILADQRLSGDARAGLIDGRWEIRIAHFKLHGDLEEARTASDSYYVADLRATTLALHAMHDAARNAKLEETEENLRLLDKTFRLLESAHNVAEVVDGLNQLATGERWEILSPRARTSSPRDWEWLEGRMKAIVDELEKTELQGPPGERIREARRMVREAIAAPAARHLNEEMRQRFDANRRPIPDFADAETVAMLVKQALDVLRNPVAEARAQLAAMTPKLHEVMAQLARESEQLKTETSEQAEKTKEAPAPEAQSDAGKMLARQETLNEKIDTLKDALRSEANKQDILEKEGREKARDVDDALAMLKDPPARAAQALQEAAETADGAPRQEQLQSAAQQQQKLADSLNQLAQHFDSANQQNIAESRAALRATEEQTGVKKQLDSQYARAEKLAELAQKSTEELLAELEKALSRNPLMQKELDSISKTLIAAAAEKLAAASGQENQIAATLGKMAADQQAQMAGATAQNSPPSETAPPLPTPSQTNIKAPAAPEKSPALPTPSTDGKEAPQKTVQNTQPGPQTAQESSAASQKALSQAADAQKPIAARTNDAGETVARAGRHEERLQNMAAGQQLRELGNEISETAAAELPAAQEALAHAQSPGQAQPAVNAANAELATELAQLQQADPRQPGSAAAAHGEERSAQTAMAGQAPPAGASARPPGAQGDGKAAPGAPPHPGTAPQPGGTQAPGVAQQTPTSAPTADDGKRDSSNPPDNGRDAAGIASPQEQRWMARTLDALDAALHAPSSEDSSSPASQAAKGMSATAQATASAMRESRGETDSNMAGNSAPRSQAREKSQRGARVDGTHVAYGTPRETGSLKNGEWGRLPKKVAAELSQGQRETVAGEYRNQVETYYRVIAEKSRKP